MLLSAVYWLTVKLYAAALQIASLFNDKAKLFVTGRKGLIEKIRLQLANEERWRIWMHCASLGEFEQGRPVLEQLRKKYPDHAIILTFFSPSGYEVRKDYKGADHVFYLPMDNTKNATSFLGIVKPQLCIFVKYELWYYYLSVIAKRQFNALLISARFRKEQPFFKFYGGLHRKMLRCFTQIFVQDKDSANLLQSIGISAIVNGDTRFDRVIEASKIFGDLPIANSFCKEGKILVAGSTWREDEVFLQKAFDMLPLDWKMILAPHEVDEGHIESIERLFVNSIRWSNWKEESNARVLIVDKVGLLLQLYRYGKVAWIGGGFGKEGVHNVLEAAVYGMPCAFGPVFHQFIEAGELINAGGAASFTSPEAYTQKLIHSTEKEIESIGQHAKGYVFSKSGATGYILDYIASKELLTMA